MASGLITCSPIPMLRPGARGPWREVRLGRGCDSAGIGHWVSPEPVDPEDRGIARDAAGPSSSACKTRLARYGYGIDATGVRRAQEEGRGERLSAAFPTRPRRRTPRPVDHHHAGAADRGPARGRAGVLRRRPRVPSGLFRGGRLGCLGRLRPACCRRGRQHRGVRAARQHGPAFAGQLVEGDAGLYWWRLAGVVSFAWFLGALLHEGDPGARPRRRSRSSPPGGLGLAVGAAGGQTMRTWK